MRTPLHHYKRPIISLAIAVSGWILLGFIFWLIPPKHWSIELITFCIFVFTLWLSLVWAIGKIKLGSIMALVLIVSIFLARLGMLTFVNFGAIVIVGGLISLVI